MTLASDNELEGQIAEWRAYMRRRRELHQADTEELEDHLRTRITELTEAGLRADEAFLIAVKRMGSLDGSQTRLGQLGDPRAEMVFQLLGVGLVQLAAAAHVGPPLGDLALQLVVAGERHRPASHIGAAIGLMGWAVVQTPRRASTTAAHWRRCSASSARPWSVRR